jgi:hypothetical protein
MVLMLLKLDGLKLLLKLELLVTLWYLKSEHEARIRFEDQLEMAMVEAEKAKTDTAEQTRSCWYFYWRYGSSQSLVLKVYLLLSKIEVLYI